MRVKEFFNGLLDAAKNFAKLSRVKQRGILMQAASFAGFDDPALRRILDDALRNSFSPGMNNTKLRYTARPKPVQVVATRDAPWRRGMSTEDVRGEFAKMNKERKLRGPVAALPDNVTNAAKGIAALSAVAVLTSLSDGFANSEIADIALTTKKYQQSGNLSMIDEVFVLHDFYLLTNDYFAANWAWVYWEESTLGLDLSPSVD